MDSVIDKLKILITDNDQWINGEGTFEGDPFFIRYRPHLSDFVESKLFPYRLIIQWPFKGPEPSKKVYEAMIELEDLLVKKFEELDVKGVLAFVYTPATSKEWHMYVQKQIATKTILYEILKQYRQYPIEYIIRKDSDWEHYKQVLDESGE